MDARIALDFVIAHLDGHSEEIINAVNLGVNIETVLSATIRQALSLRKVDEHQLRLLKEDDIEA